MVPVYLNGSLIYVAEAVCHDPWKVLLAVRLLNVTTGRMAIPIFWKIVHRWPTPQDLVNAPLDELIELIRPLGLYNKRAKWFKEISQCYIEDPPRYFTDSCATSIKPCKRKTRSSYPDTPISHFPGVGPYAFDSFRIFCTSPHGPVEAVAKEEWKHVMPNDKELIRYLRWKWAYEEHRIWYPVEGVIGKVNLAYLISLVDELAEHHDTIVGGEGYIDEFIECIVSDDC
ncbi:DNA glycosylase [Pisolithus croceorrhizus]|nr:DNA glycosylase [Pisolithus croceorrhizus]